jgi:pyruvate ferredoxin oxidoreductase beta subunit
MPATQLAITAGCAYVVRMSPTNIKKVAKVVRRAIYVAREVGPTFLHVYTSCNIEYSIPTEDVFQDAKDREKDRFKFDEFMTDEAKALIDSIDMKEKEAKKASKAKGN